MLLTVHPEVLLVSPIYRLSAFQPKVNLSPRNKPCQDNLREARLKHFQFPWVCLGYR